MCISSSYKVDLFISCICDKTDHSLKENLYETNSKKNPVWNKWQPHFINNLQPCGLELIKKVYSHQATERKPKLLAYTDVIYSKIM